MIRTLVINDLHEGVQRSGGTTISSANALREFAHEKHRQLLEIAAKERVQRVIYNGDLTDVFDIPLTDGIEILSTARDFLLTNPNTTMIWAEGNHDLSKDSSKLGTVAFLGRILEAIFPGRFLLVEKPTDLGDGVFVIPHLANQTIFDEALNAVPDGTKYLLLHCNFDNMFAGQQDHSLNITRDQAKGFRDRGIKVVLGHEHQGRRILGGSVIIVGNQFPTSISDCLSHAGAQEDGKKYCLLLDENGESRLIQTWSPDDEPNGWFAEVDWKDLRETTETGRGFIRVTGAATALEAADVIKEISAFRQRSASFVITNAVKISKQDGLEDLADSIEDVRAVDVMELLYGMLDDDQVAKIKELRGEPQ